MSEADTTEGVESEFEHTYERLWDAYERWGDGDAVDVTIEVEGVDVTLESPEHDSELESLGMDLSLPRTPFEERLAGLSRTEIDNKWDFEMRIRSAVREVVHGTEGRPR